MADPNDVAETPVAAEPNPNLEAQVADAVQAAIAAERKRIADISRACAAARKPEQAAAWIEEGISADQARERLINAMADQAGPEMRNAAAPAQQDDFASLVNAKVASGLSRATAMRLAIAEQPALHRAWLAQING